MGNAFGALGGDFTSVSINPAGLGLYRSSELVFTPTFGQSSVEANYRGNSMSDNKYNFSLHNLSYVATLPTRSQSESGLVSVNVGIGFNRLKDFNNTMLVGANNLNSSFLDYLADKGALWSLQDPAWAKHFDHVLVLDGGRLIEHGGYDELAQEGRALQRLLEESDDVGRY